MISNFEGCEKTVSKEKLTPSFKSDCLINSETSAAI
jgi:hypothetical protein